MSQQSLEKAAGVSGQNGRNDCFQLSTEEASAVLGVILAIKKVF